MRKFGVLMTGMLIFIFLFLNAVTARTISVCKSGCEYNKIQSAINAASTGDVVEITDGKTYYEEVGISKTGVVLDCNNAEISGRVIVSGSKNTIKYCTIFREGYGYGIVIQGAYNNTIEYNEVYYTERGIEIESFSEGNYIYNNNLYSNDFGIFLYFSGGNIIEGNNIHENNNDGIRSQSSRFDVINNNHIYSNKEWGIVFNGAKDVNITKNEIDHNVKEGIGIGGGYYGGFLIEDNDIYSNNDGIINYNNYNKIIGNRIYENTNYGVYVGGYINDIRENIIYSNYIGIKDDSPSFFVTDGNYINNNILCPSNTEYDIEIASNYLSSGDDNKCDTTKNWNDTGTIGCTYKCTPTCTDECSFGQTRCSGNIKQTCGNYDADACLEWGNDFDCGSDYCGNWQANYCKNNSVYRNRTCHDKGCSSSSCFDNVNTEEQLVQTCSYGCSNGVCNALQGDTNGDCKVDIFDLAKVGLCYAQQATGNCQDADLNQDGKIDIFDLATVGLNYGKSC